MRQREFDEPEFLARLRRGEEQAFRSLIRRFQLSSSGSLPPLLIAALKPTAPPLAISFLSKGQAAPVARLSDTYPEPNENGRTVFP